LANLIYKNQWWHSNRLRVKKFPNLFKGSKTLKSSIIKELGTCKRLCVKLRIKFGALSLAANSSRLEFGV
jgi:hypothetical protein